MKASRMNLQRWRIAVDRFATRESRPQSAHIVLTRFLLFSFQLPVSMAAP
jgi:hypothetical protein